MGKHWFSSLYGFYKHYMVRVTLHVLCLEHKILEGKTLNQRAGQNKPCNPR